jgi:L-ascorbate metabolism protein UlaG (beta-lactamase superfamily)
MMKKHMGISESIKAFEDLKAAHMVPIHWGTFYMTLKSTQKPVEALKKMISDRPDLLDRVHILPHGGQKTIE